MRVLLRLLAIAVAAYAVLVGALFLGQRSLLFPATSAVHTAEQAGLVGFSDVILETEDDERLRAFFRPPEPGRAMVVYFHGNGGSIRQRAPRAALLAEGGRGVLLVSYRGYAGSTGSPSEDGLAEDARAAYGLALRYAAPELIVLYGESLGSGVAVRLASENPVGAVVLDGPFAAASEVARMRYPFVPVDWLMRDPFRSIDRIGAVEAPILIIHGTADPVTPFSQAQALYDAAPQPKRFVVLEGEGHVNNLEAGGLGPVRDLIAAVEAGERERAFAAGAP